MLPVFAGSVTFIRFFFRSRNSLVLEILAFRQQLGALRIGRIGCRCAVVPPVSPLPAGGFEVIRTLVQLKPRNLLIGFNLLEGGKIDLLSLVREKTPRTKVILLTSRTPELQILEALARGARGYLAARDIDACLIKALRLVDAGEAWVPRKMVARLVDRLARLTAELKKIKRR